MFSHPEQKPERYRLDIFQAFVLLSIHNDILFALSQYAVKEHERNIPYKVSANEKSSRFASLISIKTTLFHLRYLCQALSPN